MERHGGNHASVLQRQEDKKLFQDFAVSPGITIGPVYVQCCQRDQRS